MHNHVRLGVTGSLRESMGFDDDGGAMLATSGAIKIKNYRRAT